MATFKLEYERFMRYTATVEVEADTLEEAMEFDVDDLDWDMDEWSDDASLTWVTDEHDNTLWNESDACADAGQAVRDCKRKMGRL